MIGSSDPVIGSSGHPAIYRVTAWLAFIAGLLVGGEIQDSASFAIAGAIGAALVAANAAHLAFQRGVF